jgi:predicted MFS family arabinose efflux permease
MIAGMMPSLAAALDVTVGQVGYLISLYAVGMAIGGPVLTALVLALRMQNKQALFWLLTLNVAGGVLAAMAPTYEVLAVARVLMGVASSACIGVSLTIAAHLVEPQARGRAASLVLGGLMFSPVLGVPATALIEQHFGWRASFWAIAILSMLCTAVVAAFVPASEKRADVSLATEFKSILNARLWAAYVTSGLIIGATFTAFTYFSPIFTQVTGFSAAAIPWMLALYGVANIVGNMIVGRLADRYTMAVLAGGLALLCTSLTIFALFAENTIASIVAFLGVGLTGVALNPAMAARVIRAASPGPLVNTMHTSIITVGLALGTWAGGAGIDAGYGLRSPLWVGAALALAGLLSLAPFLLRRSSRPGLAAECS